MTAAALLLPGFAGAALPRRLRDRLADGLAGVCLFAGNITGQEQLRELTASIRDANPHAVIAVDEEGGDVTRLHATTGSPHPGNAILGRLDDPALTEVVGRAIGEELADAGITLDFAPDADVNSTPLNPVIGVRSFGAEPGLVARHAAAWVRGLQSTGVAATAKHFPGHGDTVQDSHLALPVVDLPLDDLRRRELVPFAAAIAAGVRAVMTSHILLPAFDPDAPATFSPAVLGGLLRDELAFTGVIVSDALDMAGAGGPSGLPGAAVRAVAAGCDLLCLGQATGERRLDETVAALAAAARRDPGFAARIQAGTARVRALAVERSSQHRAHAVPGARFVSLSALDVAQVAAAFDIRSGVHVARDRVIVQLETMPNVAVGTVPWGPAAAGARVLTATEQDRPALPPGRQPILVGRDNHRHPWTRNYIDSLRACDPRTLVVDMGWPGEDPRYADVAAFGGSRLVGAALLAWLEGNAR